MATVRIDPERVLRICTDALAHVERNQPALDEAMVHIDAKDKQEGNFISLADSMKCIVADLKKWQACGQLACEPITADKDEALFLWRMASPSWPAHIKEVLEKGAFINDQRILSFGLKPEDLAPSQRNVRGELGAIGKGGR
jgi:hypothetical protein